jgi:hypothetical protein
VTRVTGLLLVLAATARAADVDLPGALLVVRPAKMVRLVAHPAPGTTFAIPNPDDVSGPAGTLRVLDLGASGAGDDTLPLPGVWRALGRRTHVVGFRYHGAGVPADPCTQVVLKKTVVKATCKGAAIHLTPPFAGEAAVVLTMASTGDRYCATFGGTSVKNDPALLRRKDAPAVACAAVTTTTTSSTTSSTTATTVTTTTLAPGPPLMINEVDYDQPGIDDHEFVEVYNPNLQPRSLAGLALVFVDGATNAEYLRIDLTPGGAISPGECLVVGASVVTAGAPPTATKIAPSIFDAGNAIQNGSPDGIVLLDTVRNQILDVLSYEGAITAAVVSGVPFAVNLVEGTMLPADVADSDTIAGSLIRNPTGHDTNDAATDWTFTTTPTPGAPNVFTP